MAPIRITIAFAAALAASGGALLLAPARAQGDAPLTGIPCRVSWEDTTHGGDWFESRGEAELTQIMPQGDGSFVAMGHGTGMVTYHSTARGCHLTSSDTFSASYTVMVLSEDGRTAHVDISSDDPSHRFDLLCPLAPGGRTTTSDYEPPEIPSVTAELHEGSTPISVDHASDHGNAGHAGSVTLHYCTPDHPNGR
jgi:hypothetical protein